jgi:hypothetical protein
VISGSRDVTLVLCTPDGTLLGALPPFAVCSPFWQEIADVVAEARRAYGVEVTVLRLLSVDREQNWQGGTVAYLAQVSAVPDVPLQAWPGDPVADAPHRLTYARPGGPDADLAWADGVLAARGTPRIAPAEQLRTWNLSSIWRLPTGEGPAWLKVVPPFFGHEGAILARLGPGPVPPLLGTAGDRVLMADVPGEDCYDAPVAQLLPIVGVLVGLQTGWIGRVQELLTLGLPDWRPAGLTALADDTFRRTAGQLDGPTRSGLERLLDGLPERFVAITACGIPDTLVHGDFHAGNVHGTERDFVLLDWGDCGVGHPLLDQSAFLTRQAAPAREQIQAEWARLWRAAVPGSDPDRAAALIEPIAALRQAVIYRTFLDNIEADEQVYHARDPAWWLRRAAELST